MSKSIFIQELVLEGERWRMSIGEVQSTEELWREMYPAGTTSPYGVTIEEEMVQFEPDVIGHFFIAGVTADAVMAMEEGFAEAFRAAGKEGAPTSAEGHPLESVRIWFKAFIPDAVLRVPGFDCFLGDHRTFSTNRDASARMHSEILLENLDTPQPAMSEIHRCGLTTRVNCDDGETIASATSPTDGMRFYNFRYPGAEVYDWNEAHPPAANPGTIVVPLSAPLSVDYHGIAADPLVEFAPTVDLNAHIELDLQTGMLSVTGAADDYPAFEAYALINEKHGPLILFRLDGDNAAVSLAGCANRSFSETISIGSYVAMG